MLTSNLLTVEVHRLHEKVEFKVVAQDVITRLFRLQESSRAIADFKSL